MILVILFALACVFIGMFKQRCKHVWKKEREEVHSALFDPHTVWIVRYFKCLKCNKTKKEEDATRSY